MKRRRDIWAQRWVRGKPLSPVETGQGRTFFAWPVAEPGREDSHVLKILKNQDDTERRKRFLREAATLRSLEHPGVTRWADSNSDTTHEDEELYLVTEYVNGPTLNQLVQSAIQSNEIATSIVKGVLETLQYCHNQGPVHRDIKPDNIVLRDGDPASPVLLDFGLTFNADLEADGLNSAEHRALGSKFLRLPEFEMQGPARLSPIVDVTCATGLLLYLLTGEEPRVLRDEHGQTPHRRPNVRAKLEILGPPNLAILDSIFDVGFAYDQYARWQSCERLLSELRRLRESTGEPAATFEEQLRAIRRTIAENPTRRMELQKKSIDTLCPGIADQVHNIFFKEMKGEVNAQSPSLHQGDKCFSVGLVDATDGNRRVLLTIHRSFEGNEFAIFARVKSGKEQSSPEISSDPDWINLFDPNVKDRIKAAVQRAFLFAWNQLGVPGV